MANYKLCVLILTLVLAQVALSVSPMPQRGAKVLMLKSLNSQNSNEGKMLNADANELAERGYTYAPGREHDMFLWCRDRTIYGENNYTYMGALNIKSCVDACEKADNDPQRPPKCL
jgi:hypothetical protein